MSMSQCHMAKTTSSTAVHCTITVTVTVTVNFDLVTADSTIIMSLSMRVAAAICIIIEYLSLRGHHIRNVIYHYQ
jgi:hypothetical protein